MLVSIIEICGETEIIQYYKNLCNNNAKHEIQVRERRIRESTTSMCMYYCQLGISKCDIYNSMLHDYYRYVITRWRLSNHKLMIELGRYTNPKTPRAERLCSLCDAVEDEYHAVFTCPKYTNIRRKYDHLLTSNSISDFLNPSTANARHVACFLHEIESMLEEQ